ncbi:hypothetical protein AVEN_250713-1 [Araneus ventricosus]|uniref:Uncharacterized protein n=1 Tax=Araneus ventricosus TaxID=182803 RepID=A0A4Y2N9Z9_ARAVE|nr:hypothetical protein AVEN_250713-1 [Araneus ventricosus]
MSPCFGTYLVLGQITRKRSKWAIHSTNFTLLQSKDVCTSIKPAIHFTDKLDILESKGHKNLWKSVKWLVVVGIPFELKSERGCWSLKSRFRGTLKEASEKNNALSRLKPRFEGSIN